MLDESSILARIVAVQREHQLDEAREWLKRLSDYIETNAKLRHFNANIEIEPFFRDLLNRLFGWSLGDSNLLKNQPSFDLDDEQNRISVQVTSDTSPKKIRDTLRNFLRADRFRYNRLIFVYPCESKPKSKIDLRNQLSGFEFELDRDRFDLGDLLRQIQTLSIDAQMDVLNFLRKELGPLGKALRMGADQNVEAMITILGHMMESGQPSPRPELSPDGARKLRRFQEHAEYLKRQFTLHVGCYQTVEAARKAVGLDAVRSLRCAAWLKERSLAALDEQSGDAKRAFDQLVALLLGQVHRSGNDCDESVVRYFLADELARCNVFPNPDEGADELSCV